MNSDITSVIGSLDNLLEAERAVLLAGDLDELTNLVERKEALIDALNTAGLADLATVRALDMKVRRNQDLLNGALEGIQKVARRMAAFRRVRASLETYNANGDKSVIDINTETSVEKRA